MTGFAILVLLAGRVVAAETRIGVSGALEHLDEPPGAPLWKDLALEVSWRDSNWAARGSARTVRRWERDDAEFRLAARRKWAGSWSLGLEGSAGLRGIFLPTWMVRAAAESDGIPGWIVGLAAKRSDYSGFGVWEPELRFDRLIGVWMLGMAVGFPWTEGLFPGLSGRVDAGWDWSDLGGASIGIGSSREIESATHGVLDRRALTISGGVRQALGARATMRAGASWTSLESVHDRLEGRLGLEFRLGG